MWETSQKNNRNIFLRVEEPVWIEKTNEQGI